MRRHSRHGESSRVGGIDQAVSGSRCLVLEELSALGR